MNIKLSKQLKKTVSLVMMGVVCTASVFSVGAFSRKVDIDVDNKVITTITLNNDTDKILDQAGVTVSADDIVDRHDEIDGTLKLNVKRAFDVYVSKDNEKVCVKIADGKVKDAIAKSGFEVTDNDICNLPEDQDLVSGMDIFISEKVKIKITADGESKEVCVPNFTVNKVLEYLNVAFSSEDVINVDVFSNVYEGMDIVINRIIYRETTTIEEIPFKTLVKKSELMNNSEKNITREGKNGQREVTLKEVLKDGEVISSEEISSSVISEPVDRIVLEGTKKEEPKKSNCSEPSKINGMNVISGSATAYTASAGARTATGAVPTQGVTVAVNPKKIPYGKRVTVKTLDGKTIFSGIAQDTGGALRNGSAVVDIYMNSRADCLKFGRKKVNVYY